MGSALLRGFTNLHKEWEARQESSLFVLLGFASVALLGAIEASPGAQHQELAPCYLLPIVFLAWHVNRAAGLKAAAGALLAGLLASIASGTPPPGSFNWAWNGCMRILLYLSATLLVAAFRESYDREKTLGRVDHLTHLANRRALIELAEAELARARRYKHPFTLAYVDLDDFKRINDRFGHHAGDRVLVDIAETLKKSVRSTDLVARLGGDEFAILLPETSEEAAQRVLTKLRNNLLGMLVERDRPISCSIGAVTFISPELTIEEMLDVADGLLYAVKREGKNQIRHQVLGTVPVM